MYSVMETILKASIKDQTQPILFYLKMMIREIRFKHLYQKEEVVPSPCANERCIINKTNL